jgi:hypothetical protein
MARHGKQVTPTPGVGELRYAGFSGEVDYQITGDVGAMTARSAPLRGSFTSEPDIAEAAFRAGDGYLQLESGKACRITMLGYTSGSDTAYFEIKV